MKLIRKSKITLDYEFNVLLIGKLFKSLENHLLIGTVEGTIKVYLKNELIEVLETKGSSILKLKLFDTTKFGIMDIISGDSHGNIVIFSNHQILYRDTVNGAISSIVTHYTPNNDFNIVVGDRLGFITSFKPHQSVLWKYKIPTLSSTLNSLKYSKFKDNELQDITTTGIENNKSQTVKDMISLNNVRDQFDNEFSYIITSENLNFIHIFSQGKLLSSIPIPSTVNSMCKGYFDSKFKNIQVLLGCENGFIYILHDFKLEIYCQIGFPITILHKFQLKSSTTTTETTTNDIDYLICTGDFNSLKIYLNRNLVCDHFLEDWVGTLTTGDIDNNGENIIVIGKLDNTIEYLKPEL